MASTAVGSAEATDLPLASVVRSVIAGGVFEMTGAVVSRTVTVNVPVALLPPESVALHETVVWPIGNAAPDAGAQVAVRLASMSSVTPAANTAAAPVADVASRTTSAGSC